MAKAKKAKSKAKAKKSKPARAPSKFVLRVTVRNATALGKVGTRKQVQAALDNYFAAQPAAEGQKQVVAKASSVDID